MLVHARRSQTIMDNKNCTHLAGFNSDLAGATRLTGSTQSMRSQYSGTRCLPIQAVAKFNQISMQFPDDDWTVNFWIVICLNKYLMAF